MSSLGKTLRLLACRRPKEEEKLQLLRERRHELQQHEKHRSPPCALLETPLDILLLIAQIIPLHSRLLLSQTCRALRAVLHERLKNDAACRSREEHLEYLWCIARDLPRQWVCEKCVSLHRVDGDSPSSRFYRRSSCKDWGGVVFGTALGSWSKYRISRYHVHLALKYTRMMAAGLDHLDSKSRTRIHDGIEKLLAPHTSELTTFSFKSLSVQYTIHPLIVEGRFLVKTVWSYTDDGRGQPRRTRDVITLIHACAHQPFRDSSWTMYQQGKAWEMPGNELGQTTVEASRCRMGDERSGACLLCRTDFTVEGSRMKATMRCWRDLGPEASPTHPDWKAQVGRGTTGHEPGTVRALYESAEARQRA